MCTKGICFMRQDWSVMDCYTSTVVCRNAYVYCAIYGKNFCVSAKNAFSLIMRNVVRVVVLDKVSSLLSLSITIHILNIFPISFVQYPNLTLSCWFPCLSLKACPHNRNSFFNSVT